MRFILLILTILIITVGGSIYIESTSYFERTENIPEEKTLTGIKETEKDAAPLEIAETLSPRVEVKAPPPLRAEKERETSSATLSVDGVILWTNYYRIQNGLSPLKKNTELHLAAEAKTEDMFEKQYFAHDSPEGVSAGDLARKAGYDFIAIGENLALGNFEDDKALVDAWMNSPGHRANILEEKFTEIGVEAKRGFFEGESTWLSVQEFGLARSACPEVNSELKDQIDYRNTRLDALVFRINEKIRELEEMDPRKNPQYNQKVDEYNEFVHEYNELLQETKGIIALYNAQVSSYNQCVSR